jgi:transcriptional regulator with XRE-family HTH domain
MGIDGQGKLLDKLFDNFVSLLESRLEEESQESVAKRLGCKQTTISRWLSKQRKPSLRYLLEAYKTLGGGEMSEVLTDVLGEQRAAVLLSVGDDDPEFFAALVELLESKNEDYEKLRDDVFYYLRKRKA